MQISRLYSNHDETFTPVDFNFGDEATRLNVVLGEIRHPSDLARDSHNLGKTTLLHLIDFSLLKGMWPGHFLVKNKALFEGYQFFVEIALNSGGFATVRRGVNDPNLISLARHESQELRFVDAPEERWDHFELSRSDAEVILDSWLDLRVLKPFSFRKAITYFLRAQSDWDDELKLQKFASSKDQYWKPFIARLFAFDDGLVQQKYSLDEEHAEKKARLDHLQSEVQFSEDELPQLSAQISSLAQDIQSSETALDGFSFDEEERKLVRDLVNEIEAEISDISATLYNLRFDIRQIDEALAHKDKFDLKDVKSIFDEVELHFPKQLANDYEQLVAFNRKITKERNAALRKQRKSLEERRVELAERKRVLDAQRSQRLHFMKATDTFEKFKELQKGLADHKARLVYLEEQKKKLELVAAAARDLREVERNRGRVTDELKAMVERPNQLFDRFRNTFNAYCKRVLNHDGIVYFRVNQQNNFDYEIGLSLPGSSTTTSNLSDGTSYQKLICVLFDLALLSVYEDAPFFRFVYHDGVFEGLDNRKKNNLLDVINEQTGAGKLQYIFTLIDTDLPRDLEDQPVRFSDEEVVLRLHDDGRDGRLFKIAEF
ncbi:DUF2326 domain-containing protein [uncultured Tateyamaria sp.]|uniref:DUF2326 domain-containing protein n=1 Tax=uncultured Tateyamaria sp. TaxID=455651 RepID=UPI00261D654F|nr:DUF2326 domain-containing protein [uncultured Tateyamaria sp.]